MIITLYEMGSSLVEIKGPKSEPLSVCGLWVLLLGKQSREEDGVRHTCRNPKLNRNLVCRKALSARGASFTSQDAAAGSEKVLERPETKIYQVKIHFSAVAFALCKYNSGNWCHRSMNRWSRHQAGTKTATVMHDLHYLCSPRWNQVVAAVEIPLAD